MFVSFIALIYKSRLKLLLHDYISKNRTSMKKILNELDKIKIIYDTSNPQKYELLNPLTRKQKDIINLLGMDETIFEGLYD